MFLPIQFLLLGLGMIKLKTQNEINLMAEGGKISALALSEVLKSIKVGATTLSLDRIAEDVIKNQNALPSFKTVEDYKYTTCININEGLVHGIPNTYKIKKGDIVSVDLGVLYKGFHTDLSYSVEVETNNHTAFLETGIQALEQGIFNCVKGNKIGDISNSMQRVVERAGYSVSRDLVGHGIGVDLHEDPYVPGYGGKNSGSELKVGMVFAIEIIYQKGKPKLRVANDGWTIETLDRSLGALFEHTVAVTVDRPLVLTR